MYYTQYDIQKAKNRENKKMIDYKDDENYIEHFKMMFKKKSINLYLTEQNYISNYKVPCNEVTKRMKTELNNSKNVSADWKMFDENKMLVDMAMKGNFYPSWVMYDWIDNSLVYNEEYIKRKMPATLKNFKLNMNYFKKLDKEDFNKCLDKILKLNPPAP